MTNIRIFERESRRLLGSSCNVVYLARRVPFVPGRDSETFASLPAERPRFPPLCFVYTHIHTLSFVSKERRPAPCPSKLAFGFGR